MLSSSPSSLLSPFSLPVIVRQRYKCIFHLPQVHWCVSSSDEVTSYLSVSFIKQKVIREESISFSFCSSSSPSPSFCLSCLSQSHSQDTKRKRERLLTPYNLVPSPPAYRVLFIVLLRITLSVIVSCFLWENILCVIVCQTFRQTEHNSFLHLISSCYVAHFFSTTF